MMPVHIADWDSGNAKALKSLWMCGDVHGDFRWLARMLLSTAASDLPRALIFLGDLDLEKPFDEYLAPLRRTHPSIQLGYIPGNHESDQVKKYEWLVSSKLATNLHGKVTELDCGISVAGLGGVFLGRVWCPPQAPRFDSYAAATRGSSRGSQKPSPSFLTTIYPQDFDRLSKARADILITHEAGAAHPHGFGALDQLAQSLKAKRHFHGHHHDNLTELYRNSIHTRGVDMVGVTFCGITNGLGEVVYPGPKEWEL